MGPSVLSRAAALAGASLVVSVALGWSASVAQADSPVAQGWWSSAPVGPDVPSDGLLVQGGLAGPIAYSALVYEFGSSTASQLSVTVASGSASTPTATIQLCPLQGTRIDAKQGGKLEDAPAYEQTACRPPVAVSGSGEYRFDVSSLARDGVLAVALLAASPGDRVVLESPGADSLSVSGGSGDSSGSATVDDLGTGDTSFAAPSVDSSSLGDLPSVSVDSPAGDASPSTTAVARQAERRAALSVGATGPLPRVMYLYTAIAVAALAVGGSGFLMRRMGASWTG